MPTVKDLLQASISEDALGFTDMYNEIMDERIGLAVEAKRLAVAQSIYGDEVVSEEVETETDEEVVSEDNEDLEDIDLDLEDLDISEEDIEEAEEDTAEDGEEADDQDA